MKIILPVAGMGTRLRPHTHFVPKAMLSIGTNNILGTILDSVISLNPEEIIFVTGYLSKEIEEYVLSRKDLPAVRFVTQSDPQGLGQAIQLCTPYLNDDDDSFIILGDTLFEANLTTLKDSKENILFTRTVQDPSRFGVVVADEDQSVLKLVEKPKEFISNLAITGLYYFPNSKQLKKSLNYIVDNDIRTRDELQLTDALAHMLEAGSPFKSQSLDMWLDCGTKEALLQTNTHILPNCRNEPSIKSVNILPPCYIAPNVVLENCTIGPNVTILEGSEIKHSKISNSILSKNSKVAYSDLFETVFSSDCEVENAKGSLDLGCHSKVFA